MMSAIEKNGQYECPVCNIDLPNLKTWELHSAGKKHQQNLHHAELNRRREENGLFITGFPPKTSSDSIRGFLRRFGEFSDYYFNEPKNFVLATFTEKRAADELINYPSGIYFNQRRLKISRRLPPSRANKSNAGHKSPAKAEPTAPGLNLNRVLSILSSGCTLDKLIQEIQASPEERTKYYSVVNDLKALFETRFSHVSVFTFGSTRTGLNLKCSDIDVFMEIAHDPNSDAALPTPEKLVRIGQKLMLQAPRFFATPRAITRAKTPIIKFVHRPTLISCDVSFKNALAVANSLLIEFFKNFDRRVYPYFMIIKYWAKIHEFSGCGKMSNYALITIAAFYLQQLEPPVLPTVFELRKNCPERKIDGWKCHFSEDMKAIDSSKNTMTLMELLGGFFRYFRDFNRIGLVICSLTATTIPKASFVQPDLLPEDIRDDYLKGLEERQHGLRVSADMVVQDPFELTHNLTASMGSKALKTFCAHCKLAAEIFADALKAPGSDDSKMHFLKVLFVKKPKLPANAAGDLFKMTKSEMTMTYFAAETITTVYLLPEEESLQDRADASEEETFRRWIHIMHQLLIRFFENIMKFKVEQVVPSSDSAGNAPKVQKVDTPSDVHGSLSINEICASERKKLLCKGAYRMWEGRRQIHSKITVPKDVDCFQVEEIISEHLYNSQEKTPNPDIIVNFSCEIIPVREPSPGIKFMFTDTGCQNKIFHSLMISLRSKVPYLLTKYMKYIKHQTGRTPSSSKTAEEAEEAMQDTAISS